MAKPKDPYIVLGIPRTANPCDVKRAYRRLVLAFHPDRTEDPAALERLLEVQRAYEALDSEEVEGSEPERPDPSSLRSRVMRRAPEPLGYSTWRHGVRFHPKPHSTGQAAEVTRRMRDMYTTIDAMFEGFVPELFPARDPAVAKDLFVEIALSREEARSGGTFPLTVPIRSPCPACLGSGLATLTESCVRCRGNGHDITHREFELVVPASVRDGQETSLPLGKGPDAPILRVAVRIV